MELLNTYLHDQFEAGATEVTITRKEVPDHLRVRYATPELNDNPQFQIYVRPVFKDEVEREQRELRLVYQKHGKPWVASPQDRIIY